MAQYSLILQRPCRTYAPAWMIASARQPNNFVTSAPCLRAVSSEVSSTPAALKKSVTASAELISPNSYEPTVACILQSGLRVVTTIEPLLPVGKNAETSID